MKMMKRIGPFCIPVETEDENKNADFTKFSELPERKTMGCPHVTLLTENAKKKSKILFADIKKSLNDNETNTVIVIGKKNVITNYAQEDIYPNVNNVTLVKETVSPFDFYTDNYLGNSKSGDYASYNKMEIFVLMESIVGELMCKPVSPKMSSVIFAAINQVLGFEPNGYVNIPHDANVEETKEISCEIYSEFVNEIKKIVTLNYKSVAERAEFEPLICAVEDAVVRFVDMKRIDVKKITDEKRLVYIAADTALERTLAIKVADDIMRINWRNGNKRTFVYVEDFENFASEVYKKFYERARVTGGIITNITMDLASVFTNLQLKHMIDCSNIMVTSLTDVGVCMTSQYFDGDVPDDIYNFILGKKSQADLAYMSDEWKLVTI